MSNRLLRASALASALVFSGLLIASCGGGNEGGSAANVKQAASGVAASEAAGGVAPADAGPQKIEMGDGADFSPTFAAPGTYLYHCAPHAKMVGRIVVK